MKYEMEDQEFDYSKSPTKREKWKMKHQKKRRKWQKMRGVDVGSAEGDRSAVIEYENGKIVKQTIRR